MTHAEARAARKSIESRFAATLTDATGYDFEVTIAESGARGMFCALSSDDGRVALDAARPIMDSVPACEFTDRDEDDEDDDPIDFYSFT